MGLGADKITGMKKLLTILALFTVLACSGQVKSYWFSVDHVKTSIKLISKGFTKIDSPIGKLAPNDEPYSYSCDGYENCRPNSWPDAERVCISFPTEPNTMMFRDYMDTLTFPLLPGGGTYITFEKFDTITVYGLGLCLSYDDFQVPQELVLYPTVIEKELCHSCITTTFRPYERILRVDQLKPRKGINPMTGLPRTGFGWEQVDTAKYHQVLFIEEKKH